MADELMTFFQNSYGFRLTFNTGKNMSSTRNIMLKIVRPGKLPPVERMLDETDILDKTKGIVAYTVQEGDLSAVGTYSIQLTDVTPGRDIPSSVRRFKVKARL